MCSHAGAIKPSFKSPDLRQFIPQNLKSEYEEIWNQLDPLLRERRYSYADSFARGVIE